MEPSKPLFKLPNPPQKPPHDWFSLWHVAGYLLLFAAFGAVFWFMYNIEQRRTAINTDFPVHQANVSSNWDKYSSKINGYEFFYPKDWKVLDQPTRNNMEYLSGVYVGEGWIKDFVVEMYMNPEQLSLDEWYGKNMLLAESPDPRKHDGSDDIKSYYRIGEYDVLEILTPWYGTMQYRILFSRNNLVVVYRTIYSEDASANEVGSIKANIRKSISTFKFIEQNATN